MTDLREGAELLRRIDALQVDTATLARLSPERGRAPQLIALCHLLRQLATPDLEILHEGEPLSVVELAERASISLSPLRIAVNRLIEAGLLGVIGVDHGGSSNRRLKWRPHRFDELASAEVTVLRYRRTTRQESAHIAQQNAITMGGLAEANREMVSDLQRAAVLPRRATTVEQVGAVRGALADVLLGVALAIDECEAIGDSPLPESAARLRAALVEFMADGDVPKARRLRGAWESGRRAAAEMNGHDRERVMVAAGSP